LDLLQSTPALSTDIRVWLETFNENGIVLAITYFVEATIPYAERLNIITNLNLALHRIIADSNLEIAYPTRLNLQAND
ncbi:MAG TPA: hypothetical protein PLQ36_01530, partial [Candidatus Gracilibacteria bacterium]|nr:hypothetical protein [Candidatus Gracilibacteria bacterium]